MSSIHDHRGSRRSNRGCPPVLEIDLTTPGPPGPGVEWPPAPPSRRRHSTRSATPTSPASVSDLTTGRAVRLLDATVAHLRTALETTQDADTTAALEGAIGDATRAIERLTDLTS